MPRGTVANAIKGRFAVLGRPRLSCSGNAHGMNWELAFLGILAIAAIVSAVLNARRGERTAYPTGIVFLVFIGTMMVELVRPEYRPIGGDVLLVCAICVFVILGGKILKRW